MHTILTRLPSMHSQIDPEVPSHLTQVSGYLMSWLLGAFPLASYQDEWLVHGVLGYLLTLYVEHAYGADDARYRYGPSARAWFCVRAHEQC